MKKFTVLLATGVVTFGAISAIESPGRADTLGDGCQTKETKAFQVGDRPWESGLVVVNGRDTLEVFTDAVFPPEEQYSIASGSDSVIRNIAQSDLGLVFIEDRAGPDNLVLISSSKSFSLSLSEEAEAPALLVDGSVMFSTVGSGLERWIPSQGAVEAIGKPAGATAVFSPVQFDTRTVVAVVSGYPGEVASLDNLWSYDLVTEVWKPLTEFSVDTKHWVALRTPVVTESGELFVVRISGGGDSMDFDLLAYDGTSVEAIGSVPGGLFLAGSSGDTLVWNRWSDAMNVWELGTMTGNEFVSVGCGRTATAAQEVPDPDLIPNNEGPSPAPADESADDDHQTLADLYDHAVVIGGFASVENAERVAAILSDSVDVDIIDAETSPAAVADGEWGISYVIPTGTDPEAALQRIRELLPRQYRDRAWLSWS